MSVSVSVQYFPAVCDVRYGRTSPLVRYSTVVNAADFVKVVRLTVLTEQDQSAECRSRGQVYTPKLTETAKKLQKLR